MLKSIYVAVLALLAMGSILQVVVAGDSSSRLEDILASQPEETQTRYKYRHPVETLEFFGVTPGMTVVEVLPGGGWYSKILLAFLGTDGHLIGADYAEDMFPLFGFFDPEFIESKKTWVEDWLAEADGWGVEHAAAVSAFQLGSMPEDLKGTADAALLVRALHNVARFEPEGAYLTAALQDVYDALKPGGIVGVIQHQARDHMPDEWASGARGYLKKDFLILRMEQAGFVFMAEIDINQNEKDQPRESDIVWRLPPTLATSRENPELREEMVAIGESNRMTMKFRKPE